MAKNGLKTFRVQKRFELWLETEIKAPDIETALSLGKAMTAKNFLTFDEQTEVNDETELSGMSVSENWD